VADHASGSKWHSCDRWIRFGMECPFAVSGAPESIAGRPRRPAVPERRSKAQQKFQGTVEDAPSVYPVTPKALLLPSGVMEIAEDVVSRAADAIPVFEGKETRSLGERLRVPGAVGVGVGVAAGFAVREVARRGSFGGFQFPSVFDPDKAFRFP